MKEKVLLIDTNNLAMRCVFAIQHDIEDTGFVMYKMTFLRLLRKMLNLFNPNKVIFCMEGGSNWRGEVYSDYKANRAVERKKSYIDFDKFFLENDLFISGLRDVLTNVQFMKIRELEADDLIAILVKNYPESDFTLVSSDKDFYQLHSHPNFKQYEPIKEEYVKALNPKASLLEKVVTGDKGDNIPKLKRGVGPKTFETIYNNGLDEWLEENDLRDNFDRNYKLISFDMIPQKYISIVKDEYDKFKQIEFNGKGFYDFLFTNDLSALMSEMNNFISVFTNIK